MNAQVKPVDQTVDEALPLIDYAVAGNILVEDMMRCQHFLGLLIQACPDDTFQDLMIKVGNLMGKSMLEYCETTGKSYETTDIHITCGSPEGTEQDEDVAEESTGPDLRTEIRTDEKPF